MTRTEQPSPRPRVGYLPTLDGWRAIAIFLVLCAHTSPWPHLFDILRFPLNSYGHLGVDVFFALSGLLICHRLLEEEAICGRISLKGFYIRRCFRIFPPAFLYLGVVGLLGLLRILPTEWLTWWSAVLFARNYGQIFSGDNLQNVYTAHFWSLGVEEHFYLLLPAILVFLPTARKYVLFLLTLVSFAWVVLYVHLVPLQERSFFWYRRSDLHMASLLFPAWLAVMLTSAEFRRGLRKVLHPAVLPILVVLLVGAKYVDKHLHPERTREQTIRLYDPQPPLNTSQLMDIPKVDRPVVHWPMLLGNPATVLTFLVPIFAPFLILSTLLRPESYLSRFLELAPMRYVGRLSYSLYLWQQIFWQRSSKGWPISVVQDHPWYVGLIFTFAAAMLSFYLVERPLIRMGHRFAPPATSGHRDTAGSSATT